MSGNPEEQEEEVNDPSNQISNVGHPLLNQLVASRLFEVVNLPQLRTLRLVCKDWLSLSLPIWRRTLQINICSHSSIEGLLQWESLGSALDLAEEQPFRNFRLDTPQFLSDISRPHIKSFSYPTNMTPASFEGTYRNMEQFWVNYGHWIHKLELKKVYVTDVEAFKRAIFEQTPNLQELTLDQIIDGRDAKTRSTLPVQGNEDEGRVQPNLKAFTMKLRTKLPFGWRLFFIRFPNIQKLELPKPDNSFHSDVVAECVENMLMSPARRPNLPITDLRLGLFLDGSFEKLLLNPLVRLKLFHLTLYFSVNADKNFDMLRMLMHHHGNTLKELHLQNDFMFIDVWGCLEGGPYIALTELEMKGSALPSNFHFLNKLPNLQVLRLEQLEEGKMLKATNWTSLKKMPRLREFHFIVTSLADILSEKILERFGELMPNLESFTGHLNQLTLPVACRNWGKLRKLVIKCGFCWNGVSLTDSDVRCFIMDIDDVGITGIVRGSDKRVPCVADLQELRHLTLEHVTFIGNASVFNGFFKLPHLSYLNICGATGIWEGIDALRSRLQGGLTITPMFG